MAPGSSGCVVLMERGAKWPPTLAVLTEQKGPMVIVRVEASASFHLKRGPERIGQCVRPVPKRGSFDALTPDGASTDPSLRLARGTRVQDDQVLAILRDRCASVVQAGGSIETAVLACGSDPEDAIVLSHPRLLSGLLEQLTRPANSTLVLITDEPSGPGVNRLLMLASPLIERWIAAGMTVDIRSGSDQPASPAPGLSAPHVDESPQVVLDGLYGNLATVKNTGGQRRLGRSRREHFGEVLHRARPAGGDHR